jgi:hypothetical protein
MDSSNAVKCFALLEIKMLSVNSSLANWDALKIKWLDFDRARKEGHLTTLWRDWQVRARKIEWIKRVAFTILSSKERWSCRQGCLEAKMTRFWRHQALGYYISWLLGLSALLQVPGWSAYQAVGRADRDAFKLKLLDFEDTKLYAGVLYFLKSHLSSVKIKSFYHQCIPVCKTTCTHWAF